MSFILEALKKSQQERALGQIPRVDTGLLVEEPAGPQANPWIVLALLLAFAAVGIALYALLREPRQPETAAHAASPGPSSAQIAGPVGEVSPAPQDPARRSDTGPAATWDDEPGAPTGGLRYGPALPGAEAPPPRPARSRPLVRPAPEESLPAPPATRIPEDLIEDIAAFREQVRREQQGAAAKPADGVRHQEASGDPRKRRLPEAIRGRLPTFLITAHIYDTVPDKRFIVINSLKYAEGERTREGLEVLEILPDGVLLGFEGHSFFNRR